MLHQPRVLAGLWRTAMPDTTSSFTPHFTLTPLIQRQLLAIDACRGFLEAVRLRDDWGADLQRKARVQDALSSVPRVKYKAPCATIRNVPFATA